MQATRLYEKHFRVTRNTVRSFKILTNITFFVSFRKFREDRKRHGAELNASRLMSRFARMKESSCDIFDRWCLRKFAKNGRRNTVSLSRPRSQRSERWDRASLPLFPFHVSVDFQERLKVSVGTPPSGIGSPRFNSV